MKKLLAAAAFAAALAGAPSAASAQAPIVGFRVGYGIPFGTAAGTSAGTVSQRDYITSAVPLQLDAGFKMGPADLAGYFAYGFGTPESSCPGTCSANVIRAGLQGILHSELRPGREIWAGVLAGWERTRLSPGAGGASVASGFEGGLQGGFDFASSTTGFGPFGQLTIGQYDSIEQGGANVPGFDKKFHGTFQVGVRGYFKI